MRTSNTMLFKVVIALYALSLAACNLPTPQKPAESNDAVATFTAQVNTEKSKALDVEVQGPFALPGAKIFNLQACIKDRSYNKPIIGHDFYIEEVNQTITTDKLGCITWPERISFNFLADSQYIRIDRTIKGKGLNSGTQSVSYAVNPWSHGENLPAVLNPEDGNIPRIVSDKEEGKLALRGFSTDTDQVRTRNLWVDNGRLFLTNQRYVEGGGVYLNVEMRPNVAIQLTKMNGELTPRELTAGTFKARMSLIHIYYKNGKELRAPLGSSEEMTVTMENGILAIKSVLFLKKLPTLGQVMLGLELDPQSAPPGLLSFDGVYLLGEHDHFKRTTVLRLNTLVAQTKNFKISDYINSDINEISQNTQNGVLVQDAYQTPKIIVKPLQFDFIRVGEETTTEKEIFYRVRACFEGNIDQNDIRAHTFKVTKFRTSNDEKSVDTSIKNSDESCIYWTERISFKPFECHRYLKGYVQIENTQLGLNEKIDMLINPWSDRSNSMARDLRHVEKDEILPLSCEDRAASRLIIEKYGFNTRSYDYGVDENLSLTIIKNTHLQLDLRLPTYSSFKDGRENPNRMRDGIYLLKLAVVKNIEYNQENTYVTSASKIVNVIAGIINTEVQLKVQDPKEMGNRNTVLFELYPVKERALQLENGEYILKDKSKNIDSVIDHNSGLISPTYTAQVILSEDGFNRPLFPLDATAISQYFLNGAPPVDKNKNIKIADIVKKGLKTQRDLKAKIKARANIPNFVKQNHLDLISLANADEKAPLIKIFAEKSNINPYLHINKTELQNILTTGKIQGYTAKKLCAFWTSDYFRNMYAKKGGALKDSMMNPLGMDCYSQAGKDPSKFFIVEKQLFVEEFGGFKYLAGFNRGLTVGTGFSLSTSYSKSLNRSFSVGGKIGLTKKFSDFFSIGPDAGFNIAEARSNSNSSSNSISVNENTSLNVLQNVFNLRVNKHQKCMILRLNPKLFIKDTRSWIVRDDYIDSLNPELTDEEKGAAVTRGVMVCEGIVHKTPIDIVEDYYIVSQDVNTSNGQDSGDEKNRNLYIALRSTSDYNRLVFSLRKYLVMPESANSDDNQQIQASSMLENIFALPPPSAPGIIYVK